MRLNILSEAYDKALAKKVSIRVGMSEEELRKLVGYITPDMKYGTWVLKQYAKIQPTRDQAERLRSALIKFDAIKNQLADKNINNYDIESLESATKEFKMPSNATIHPIKEKGVNLLKTYDESEDVKYYAYLMSTIEALTKWSSSSNWCVRKENFANVHLKQSPQIMIFKNDSPTTLFSFDKEELKNSGNTQETRPEILKIVEDIILNFEGKIKEILEGQMTPAQLLISQIKSEPIRDIKASRWNPNELSDREEQMLLADPEEAFKYIVQGQSNGLMPYPNWPAMDDLMLSSLSEAGFYTAKSYIITVGIDDPTTREKYFDYLMEMWNILFSHSGMSNIGKVALELLMECTRVARIAGSFPAFDKLISDNSILKKFTPVDADFSDFYYKVLTRYAVATGKRIPAIEPGVFWSPSDREYRRVIPLKVRYQWMQASYLSAEDKDLVSSKLPDIEINYPSTLACKLTAQDEVDIDVRAIAIIDINIDETNIIAFDNETGEFVTDPTIRFVLQDLAEEILPYDSADYSGEGIYLNGKITY